MFKIGDKVWFTHTYYKSYKRQPGIVIQDESEGGYRVHFYGDTLQDSYVMGLENPENIYEIE